MDLIIIAGIKRSASTAQWNLVRLALEMAGYNVLLRGHSFDLQEINSLSEKEVLLCKRHPFSKPIAKAADHIFLTDRNDEEILASLDRMWDSGNPNRLEGMRKDLEAWKQYDHHYFRYFLIVDDPIFWARKTIEYLGLDIDHRDVLKEFNKIEPPEDKQDPVTLLFPNHIS